MGGSAKRPKKTAEEIALERRQRSMLDEEIEESEQRLKALSRRKLGRDSLLSGAPSTAQQASRRAGSMLSGGTSRGGGFGGGGGRGVGSGSSAAGASGTGQAGSGATR